MPRVTADEVVKSPRFSRRDDFEPGKIGAITRRIARKKPQSLDSEAIHSIIRDTLRELK